MTEAEMMLVLRRGKPGCFRLRSGKYLGEDRVPHDVEFIGLDLIEVTGRDAAWGITNRFIVQLSEIVAVTLYRSE